MSEGSQGNMDFPFEIYTTSDLEPDIETIQQAVNEIYQNTKYGDYGAVTQEEIGYIIFSYNNNEWTYVWDSIRGYGFERIRRITGYLVGTLDRFNDGKKSEERDRVKHNL